jgi:hypothetical protein
MAASPALGCTDEEMQQAFAPLPPQSREPHPMVEAVRNLLDQRHDWTGSATELMDLRQPVLSCQEPGASPMPEFSKTPKGLSQRLRKCSLTLADTGIELKFRHLHGKKRIIELREERGGASWPRNPPDAPPDFEPTLQPTETECFRTA